MMRPILMLLCLSLASCQSQPTAPFARGALQTFELAERFGVSHPDQIVFFDLKRRVDPTRVAVVDESGKRVLFQVMSDGRLALRTDLPANATRKWALVKTKPGTVTASDLGMGETEAYTEITNNLIGIRIPRTAASLTNTPSPIQGLRYRDGTWTAIGPNYLERPALAMKVEWLERGPLVARAKITYRLTRAELRGAFEKEVIPPGEGEYACTIEVQAGQPSILFQEHSEVEIAWSVNADHGLQPDRAQYRGHRSTSVEAGRNADGTQYGMMMTGAGLTVTGARGKDALVDLYYASGQKDRWSEGRYPFLSHWDPWAVDTGYYWQLYSSASANDNLLGIFAGPASRLGKTGLGGVCIDTRTIDGKRFTGVRLKFARLMPTQYYARTIRFDWGLYLGRKSEDVKPLDQVQGICRQMNEHSGVNLTKLQHITGEYPDPRQGYGNLYVTSNVWWRIARELQDEKTQGGSERLRNYIAEDSSSKPLFEFWLDWSPAAATTNFLSIDSDARDYLETLVNGQGIYRHDRCYFMAALNMSGRFVYADQLLGSGLLTAEQKHRLKLALELYTACLWDHDVAPMQEGTNVNWGPANMSSMWLGTRYFYTLMLAANPKYRARAKDVADIAVKQLRDYVNEHGAASACTHYTGASMIPILNLMQQLQMSGIKDHFREEPLLAKFGEFYLQQLTPPEVRFGGVRKVVAIGDGSTEQSVIHGQLGTGFAAGRPELSKRLMGAWQEMGSPHNQFFGPSRLKIDPSLPAESPRLGSAHFEGWYSVLRYGWGTTNETAVWFINGDTQTDHRHNDQGSVLIYALGAPLSLDWGPIYYPRVAGGLMHSTVTPESIAPAAWDVDNTPLDKPDYGSRATWWETKNESFLPFACTASSTSSFRQHGTRDDVRMRRTVRLVHADPTRPVILIEDDFAGEKGKGAPMISTLNLAATGEVKTPAGNVTPETRFYNWRDNAKQQMPSSTKAAPLAAGLHRFQFTGQWLIDWDLYVDAAATQQFALGNWGHNWHPSPEQNEFRKSQGREFEERQHILRLRGTDRFLTLILPRRKDDTRPLLDVQRQGDGWSITGANFDLSLTGHAAIFQSAERKIVTTFNAEPLESFGVRLEGGPAEVAIASTNAMLTVAGSKGTRKVTLPKSWSVAVTKHDRGGGVIRQAGQVWTIEYMSDQPLGLKLSSK